MCFEKLTGVFDNQGTMAREGWADGNMLWADTAILIQHRSTVLKKHKLDYVAWGGFPDFPRLKL